MSLAVREQQGILLREGIPLREAVSGQGEGSRGRLTAASRPLSIRSGLALGQRSACANA